MTRETAAINAGPGQADRNGHASADWPASPAPLPPRTMPMTSPGPVKPPAASSTRRTGLTRPQPVAGRPVRRELRVRDTAGTGPWLQPSQALEGGADVTALARMSKPKRTRPGQRRRRPAGAGHAIGVSGGRWRVRGPGGGRCE